MTRPVLLLALLLPLSACAGFRGPPEPVAARLTAERLDVTLSTAQVCVGRWAQATEGPLDGCPDGWRYAVTPETGTNPARILVGAVLEALTLDSLLVPRATVTVSDPQGRAWSFRSPAADGD
jgi:hypothetical protein